MTILVMSLPSSIVPAYAQLCNNPITIISLVGDKDALGTGTLPGNNLPPGPFDNRSPAEMAATDGSENTDVVNGQFGRTGDFDYFHTFSIPGGFTISSVDLEFGLGGMQSNDNDPNTKTLGEDGLFVDGVLIPDAFEMVSHTAFTYTLEPVSLTPADFVEFLDGAATIRIETNSFGGTNVAGGNDSPVFFDYSEITIIGCSGAVGGEILPINSMALMLAGVQSISMWMIPVVVAGAGIGVFVTMRSRK